MDLKAYFRQIRQIEQGLEDPFVVIVSEPTDDGGQAGIRTEVPRYIAAKMMVERRARLASAEEARRFREEQTEARRAAEQLAAASRMQFTIAPAKPGKQ
ncbi:MAG TPA: hypothetical protein VFA33_30240 [Bryobacteraceae bacterium]|nr:hypothetical protein [Bryobacteraceae bacterium]